MARTLCKDPIGHADAALRKQMPTISRIAFLTIEPRDVVVIESPAALSLEQCDHIKQLLKRLWPKNRVLVLSGGMTLKIGTEHTNGNGQAPDPDDFDEMSHPATLQLLLKAGADVTLADVTGWTRVQRESARTWALQELDAQKHHGQPVRWPAHVKHAHTRRPARKRRATP